MVDDISNFTYTVPCRRIQLTFYKNQCLAHTYYRHGFAAICENDRHAE